MQLVKKTMIYLALIFQSSRSTKTHDRHDVCDSIVKGFLNIFTVMAMSEATYKAFTGFVDIVKGLSLLFLDSPQTV